MVALRIALRYLFSKKKHNAVNVISIVSIAGVAVATLAIVCVLSVFNGFSRLALSRMSLIDPQLKAVPEHGKVLPGGDSLARIVTDLPDVALAVATVSDQALAIFRGHQLPLTVHGVPESYTQVVAVDSAIIDGVFALADEYGYPAGALSVGAALNLGARPNPYEPVGFYAPRRVGRINPANPMGAFTSDSVLVAGVWQVNDADADEAAAYIPLEVARQLFDYQDGEASAIEISLHPGADEGHVQAEIENLLGGWRVLNRLEQQSGSFSIIAIEKWITFLMLAFILLIAAFNVVSTLSMVIIEKRDDMATLRALGATQGRVRAIFTWEGWLISMLGGVTGIVTGSLLCLGQEQWGWLKLNGDPTQLTIDTYPVDLQFPDLLIVLVLVAAAGLLVGLIAGRMVRTR